MCARADSPIDHAMLDTQGTVQAEAGTLLDYHSDGQGVPLTQVYFAFELDYEHHLHDNEDGKKCWRGQEVNHREGCQTENQASIQPIKPESPT